MLNWRLHSPHRRLRDLWPCLSDICKKFGIYGFPQQFMLPCYLRYQALFKDSILPERTSHMREWDCLAREHSRAHEASPSSADASVKPLPPPPHGREFVSHPSIHRPKSFVCGHEGGRERGGLDKGGPEEAGRISFIEEYVCVEIYLIN